MTRRCYLCGEWKPITDFGLRGGKRGLLGHLRSDCNTCRRQRLDELISRNLPRPSGVRARDLRRTWGISLAEYDALLDAQNGGCAICAAPKSNDGRRLAVDHEHASGLIRGLLCARCNRALALVENGFASTAQRYLDDPPALAVIGRRRAR